MQNGLESVKINEFGGIIQKSQTCRVPQWRSEGGGGQGGTYVPGRRGLGGAIIDNLHR